jgi:hypothetical protein
MAEENAKGARHKKGGGRKDEKYPDAVIICPASDVGEDEFQSKKSLPPNTSIGDSFYFLLFTFSYNRRLLRAKEHRSRNDI